VAEPTFSRTTNAKTDDCPQESCQKGNRKVTCVGDGICPKRTALMVQKPGQYAEVGYKKKKKLQRGGGWLGVG